MSDLHLNYTDFAPISKKRKRLLVALGIILIVSSVLLFIYQLSRELNLSLVIPAVANALLAILVFLQAVEHKILFPEKYIRIGGDSIEYKLGRLFRLKRLDWDSVEKVEMKKNSIQLKTGADRIRISMLHFPASDEIKIRSTIKIWASNKGIPVE